MATRKRDARRAGRAKPRAAKAPARGAKAKPRPAARRPEAHEAMLGLVTAYWTSQLVFVVAKLGVADALAEGPLAVDALARRVGAHAPSLRRVLRALASHGVFAERSDGRFAQTPLSATLRDGVPGSLRDFARMIVEDYNWRAWGHLLHAVRSGERPFDQVHGKPAFEWMRDNPEHERIFSASMAAISSGENAAIAKAYPFGSLGTLVDVGGAHGHLLGAILRRHRGLRGILFDQPQVIESAHASGFLADLDSRCEMRGGSFFDAVPDGADGYLMKYILHDWDDPSALRILERCRDAMAPGGRVIAAEHVLKAGNGRDWGKLLDINMLVIPGGQERTREEFADLFASAGLRLARVWKTACPLHVLEAVRN